MAKKDGNKQNLIDSMKKTPEERRAQASKAGKASAAAKKKRKDMRECLNMLLEKKVGIDDDGKQVTGAEALSVALFEKAMSGNNASIQLILDNTTIKAEKLMALEIERERQKLEREKWEWEKQRAAEADPQGKSIKIEIGGYQDGWED